ncbi:uncharacterized protein LOC144652231 isoform X3 [Oculina patagonica]
MSLQTKESESSSCPLMTSVEEHQESSGPDTSSRKLRVTFLASEWGSSKGGLSTVNRELAINVAKDPDVHVTIFVPQCNDEDQKAALSHRIDLVKAKRRPGYDELEWLSFPPDDLQIDVVVGHGVKLGHQAQVIRESHNCKWVQVVHTAPEELGMYKTYSNPVSVNEEKHETEVELCEMADFVVTVGPKLSDAFRSYLRGCKKDQIVFEFTPGLFAEFSDVKQVDDERKKFKVLVFGRGDKEDFELKGFDIAAKAVAMLDGTHLVFVGAPNGKQDEVKNRLLECGIAAQRLTVRSFLQSRESLKNLLCEVDLALMPSRTEAFGLTGLEALSAGLPILVSGNSGFGEALSKVSFGSSFVVDSDEAEVWAKSIKHISGKERRKRLQESKSLRTFYREEYSWERQTKSLIDKMVSLAHDASAACQSSTGRTIPTQEINVLTDYSSGTVPMEIKINTVIFQKMKSRDPMQQEEAKRIIMSEMTKQFLKTTAAQIPSENIPLCLHYYLKGVLDLIIREASEGSLRIIVECSTLEILERLWEDYRSGNLNAVAEECLLTDDIKTRFDVESVMLKTIILEEDYLACKLFLMDISRVNYDSTVNDDELLPQNQSQAADETQTQTTEKPEPMTVQLAVNYGRNLTNTQGECWAEEEKDERPKLMSGDILEEKTTDVEELPQYIRHLKIIHNSTPREGNENSLRIAVECHNLESLERLWEDYRSGRLDAITEKRLVTDDIKKKFQVESVDLTTTILEEDYLACKEFLLNKPKNTDGSTMATASEGITILTTEGTLIQSSAETQTQDTDKCRTLASEKTQIQPPEETQTRQTDKRQTLTTQETVMPSIEETKTQAAAESETLTSAETQARVTDRNETLTTRETAILSAEETQIQPADECETLAEGSTFTPSLQQTRTLTVEGIENQTIAETQIPSSEEIHIQGIDESANLRKEETQTQSTKEIWTKEMETQATDQTQIPTAPTEDTQIKFPVDSWTQTEGRESQSETLILDAFNPTLDIDAVDAYSFYEAFKINTTLTYLDLSGKNVGDAGARSLSESLKINTTLTELDVSNNDIGDGGAHSLSEVLKVNPSLTKLDVSKNDIRCSGACSLSEALKVNTSLTKLDVSKNNIRCGGARSLSEALKFNISLTVLDVSKNDIGCGGACSLTDALKVNPSLTKLDVSKNDIRCSGACSLSEALKVNTSLTKLGVSKNDIGYGGARSLSEALKVNTSLRNLDVSKNYIGDDGARSLFEALKVNPSLTNLDVSKNYIGDEGARSLFEALKGNPSLTNLNVSKNYIGDDGARSLSEVLKVNTILTNLNVIKNYIGDDGARSISEGLKGNPSLTNLDVSKNYIGEDGARSLSEVFKVNTSLTYLDVSENYIGIDGTRALSERLKDNLSFTNLVLKKNKDAREVCYPLVLEERATRGQRKPKQREITDMAAGKMKDAKKSFNPPLDTEALKINTTLTYLDLRGKQIDENGARSLSEVLKVNATLTYLDVSENNIDCCRGATFIFDALKHNTTLTNLNVSKNNIGNLGADSLSSALKHNATLTNLDVSKNNIGSGGAYSLSSALKQNATLNNLDVSKNNIGAGGAYSLSSALKQNATLNNLDVSKNNIGSGGAYSLSSALKQNATLNNLDVSKNNIGSGGAYSLSSALKQNATLTNLNVSQNNIGPSGAYFLSSALEHNATLTNLDMSKNNIGPSGADSLSSALKHNATLTILNVSNNNIGKQGADDLSKILQHNTTLTVLDVSENNADLEARSISEIFKTRTTSRLNKPGKKEITDVDASSSLMKDKWGRLGPETLIPEITIPERSRPNRSMAGISFLAKDERLLPMLTEEPLLPMLPMLPMFHGRAETTPSKHWETKSLVKKEEEQSEMTPLKQVDVGSHDVP